MNTGDIPRAMAQVARHRTLPDLRDAIAQALLSCGVEHVQVWLGGDGEGTFVQHEGHGCIQTLPLTADGDLADSLVVRVSEPLAGFQHEHLRTFASHAAALVANARAFERAAAGQRDARVAVAQVMARLQAASEALRPGHTTDAVGRARKNVDEVRRLLEQLLSEEPDTEQAVEAAGNSGEP